MTKMTKSMVDVDTTEWRRSHGSEPRGRGSWAFALGTWLTRESPIWCPGSVTYAQARRWALAQAVERGFPIVFVLS